MPAGPSPSFSRASMPPLTLFALDRYEKLTCSQSHSNALHLTTTTSALLHSRASKYPATSRRRKATLIPPQAEHFATRRYHDRICGQKSRTVTPRNKYNRAFPEGNSWSARSPSTSMRRNLLSEYRKSKGKYKLPFGNLSTDPQNYRKNTHSRKTIPRP